MVVTRAQLFNVNASYQSSPVPDLLEQVASDGDSEHSGNWADGLEMAPWRR